jgi:hypothetical protein
MDGGTYTRFVILPYRNIWRVVLAGTGRGLVLVVYGYGVV